MVGGAHAQERHAGSAIVRVGDTEYVIPIECYDASRPELGFSTEPSRITRERTGRSNPIRLNVRPWKDTSELIVSLDRYVAWIPMQASSGGVLNLDIDMSPASSVVDGIPVALTYYRWKTGERAPGLNGVVIIATCGTRDPEAPTSRKMTKAGEP